MSQTVRFLFVSALANAISWIILIPVWQYPDEQAHFAQIQYKTESGGLTPHNRIPDTSYEIALSEKILETERDESGDNKFTYHPQHHLNYTHSLFGDGEQEIISLGKQERNHLVKNEATQNPPFYYYLGSYVYKIFSKGSLFTRVYAIRFLSALIFIGTIYTSYKIGQVIFKKNKLLQISLPALIAFMPMLVFTSTGILPDTLTNFLFSAFIYICLVILKDGLSPTKISFLFVLIFLGSITRQHFLITLAIVPFVILEQFITNNKLRKSIIILSAGFLISLYILSFFISSLSFINRLDYPESSRKIANNPLSNLTYLEHLKWTLKRSVAETWPWYWGIYKWLSLSLPHTSYQIINRLIPIAFIGLLLKIVQIARSKEIKKNTPIFFLLFTISIYFFALTTFDYLFRKNNGFSFGIQGRYFFPTIVAQMALLLIGFNKFFEIFFRRYSKYGILILVTLMIIFNVFSLSFVSSTYYNLSNIKIFVIQASQYKPLILKGNIILIILGLGLASQTLFLASYALDVLKLKS